MEIQKSKEIKLKIDSLNEHPILPFTDQI